MKLKLAGNTPNRLQYHTEDKKTHKQNQVLSIFFQSCSYFPAPIINRSSPQKSLRLKSL